MRHFLTKNGQTCNKIFNIAFVFGFCDHFALSNIFNYFSNIIFILRFLNAFIKVGRDYAILRRDEDFLTISNKELR